MRATCQDRYLGCRLVPDDNPPICAAAEYQVWGARTDMERQERIWRDKNDFRLDNIFQDPEHNCMFSLRVCCICRTDLLCVAD